MEFKATDAKKVAVRVDNSMAGLEFRVTTFKVAHEEYLKKIKDYVVGHDKQRNLPLDECNNYFKEVKERVYSIVSLHGSFKFKLEVPE